MNDNTSMLKAGTLCWLHLPSMGEWQCPNEGRVVEVVRFLGRNELFQNGRADSYAVVCRGTLHGVVPACGEHVIVPPGEVVRAPRPMLRPICDPPPIPAERPVEAELE